MKNLSKLSQVIILIAFGMNLITSCGNIGDTTRKNNNESELLSALILAQTKNAENNLEIDGYWSDNWSSTHTISNSVWKTESSYGTSERTLPFFDNNSDYLIYQDGPAAYYPNTYGRIVWHMISPAKFAFCEDVYGKTTFGEVYNSNAVKPVFVSEASANCGGSTWTIALKIN
jgi:hypothetical protein